MRTGEASGLFASFIRREDGQDLIEYSLLLALLVLSTAALIISSGQSSKAIWNYNDQMLTQATTVAQSTGAGSGGGGSVPTGFGNGAGNSGAGGSTNGVGNGNSFGNGNGNGLGVGNGNGAGNGAGNGNSSNGRGNR